jgi:creatine kinase
MGAGTSVPDPLPKDVDAALAAGFTKEQIDAYFCPPKNNSRFGGVINPDDPKNTDEFRYFTYPKCPEWVRDGPNPHKSGMSKVVTPEIFEKFKDVKTSKGYSFHNAIQTGTETPHLGVGITAGDEESWTAFKDVMFPVIKMWHNWDPETNDHASDLDYTKLKFSDDQKKLFNEYVVSTRIRAARNLKGLSLPSGTDDADRAKVEEVLSGAFKGFEGDLKGVYYKLGELTDDQKTDLRSNGFLFQKPKTTNLLTNAGAARNWPASRGIFHNESRTALCWVNEEDHCRIISMSKDGDVASVFERFCKLSNELLKVATSQGTEFMVSKKLGFLGSCPSNLGTGLRGSVMIKLPELNKDVPKLEELCAKYDLQPRGSAGEHSAAVGGKWDISNKQRIGFSEVQLVQKMIDGVCKIIEAEKELAAAAAK